MSDPRTPDPRNSDPAYEDRLHTRPPLADPAADPLKTDPVLADRPIDTRGRGGWIAAGIIAVLLVIAVIAFTSGTTTDPGTTAVIPDQTQQTTPDTTAPDAAPAQPDAPVETMPAPNVTPQGGPDGSEPAPAQ